MAVPKRKLSRSRTRHRRSNWLAKGGVTVARCRRCKSPNKPHTVCSFCGHYAGREVLDVEE